MRHLIIIILTLLLACSPPPYNTFESDYEKPDQTVGDPLYRAIEKLTNKIVTGFSSEDKTSIAVIEFSNITGSISVFGQFIAEKLISKLFETQRFEIIERGQLNKIIEEYKLGQAGITAPDIAASLGKLLGVKAIITGTITDVTSGFDVNARIIDTQSGKLLSAASVVVAKDEMVLKLLQQDYPEPEKIEISANPVDEYSYLPSGAFSSAIQIDTRVLFKLGPVFKLAQKSGDAVELVKNVLIWKKIGKRDDVAYVHRSGKITILSEQPLSSQSDMEIFRSAYVLIADYIIPVNLDMNKKIRNQAWEKNLTVYNYEGNTYKRILGYLRGKASISIPDMNIKQISMFVFADGWNNQIFLDKKRIANWRNKGSKSLDVTKYLIYGDHELEIKQYGGSKPFFVFEFFVESTTRKVRVFNQQDLNIRDSVPCLPINQLRLQK